MGICPIPLWVIVGRSGPTGSSALHRTPPSLTCGFSSGCGVLSAGLPLTVEGSGVQWGAVVGLGGPAGPGDGREVGVVFLGTHTPRLDDKGRLILPPKFRDELAGGVGTTQGQERRLYVFPAPEFQRIAGQLPRTPMTHKAARAYSRVFFASAHDEVPDKQGRVTIPGHL